MFKKMNFLIPKLHGDKYANLVTAFAVIITVEYSGDGYDIWDSFLGVLAIVLGYSFIKTAKTNKDFWYSLITVSLISLGLVTIFRGLTEGLKEGLKDFNLSAFLKNLFESGSSQSGLSDSAWFLLFIIIDIIGIIILYFLTKKSSKLRDKL
ncbi:MAG: hypothetical protein QNJ66_14510 [Crocosphaera sp.]|nr:hypothetical protein [Crocosphaera sp.]MDJ0581217.1 hypothetical protein [Crocosphaera sp.]